MIFAFLIFQTRKNIYRNSNLLCRKSCYRQNDVRIDCVIKILLYNLIKTLIPNIVIQYFVEDLHVKQTCMIIVSDRYTDKKIGSLAMIQLIKSKC